MFPVDKYTPHGYLDNPAHGWGVGPGGVLRSRSGLGMGWHYPSFAHAYNRKWEYRAFLQLGLYWNGRWLFEQADFEEAGFSFYSDYHSKSMFSLVFEQGGLRGRVIFFVAENSGPESDALGCLVQLANRSEEAIQGRFSAVIDYERNLEQGLDWTSGLFCRSNQGGLTVAAFQEGTALHFRSAKPAMGKPLKALSLAALQEQLAGNVISQTDEPLFTLESPVASCAAAQVFEYNLAPNRLEMYALTLCRDVSEFPACTRATRLLENDAEPFYKALAAAQEEDKRFWQSAPQLSGDWPDYVRRGLVYDLETLRMLVRRPMGIYKNPWDAMQIQVPRTVLAEAALDMLILSYADPIAAKAVIYGTFADAPEPNIPCSREDGSYNMVAVDGSPCGTAPEWCFPFHCIELIYRRTGDRDWLSALYPYLENFINFWVQERTDKQGRPFYKCSWEAGQDNSPRFGIKDDPSGGGALTEHLWPVDLTAALTQACWLLASWGQSVGMPDSRVQHWNELGSRFAAQVHQLWDAEKSWFFDYNRRTEALSDVLDTMQLAPFLCRVASPAQIQAVLSQLANPPKHGQIFHALMWPSIAFCLIEACSEAGYSDLAAQHSWAALRGVYRWLDSRPPTTEPDKGGLPGVGREYWPQVGSPDAEPPRGGGGAEVYGWGCLSAYMLLRYVIGFQEERGPAAIVLRPNLPDELLQPGKVYTVRSLAYLNVFIDITYKIKENKELEVTLILNHPIAQPETRTFNINNGGVVKTSL